MSAQFGLSQVASVDTGQSVGFPTDRWESAYRGIVVLSDLLVVVIALRIGAGLTDARLVVPFEIPGVIAAVSGVALIGAMVARRVWETTILGQGAEEFRRLGSAVLSAVVVLALAALAVDVGDLKPWVFAIIPITGIALGFSRYALRRVLHAQRRRDRCMHPVLAAGSVEEVGDLIARTRRERHHGWMVTGVCVPGGIAGVDELAGVQVLGELADVAACARRGGHRVVAVAPDAHWTRKRLRELAWDLEGASAELVVAPALMEVTGPRLNVSPTYGLTLLRVSQPTFSGGRWMFKAIIDRVAALLAVLLLAPVLLAVAVAIRLEDGGPVLFRQVRVGKGGELFSMYKFRSMVVDAEHRLDALATVNEAAGPLFKLRADPRVTRVGALIRRYSLDELPQLLNVVAGTMSLVGPRPPLPREVERYGIDARRRLLVRPGLTGLWQVSGRSDLSWEETVRLDLRYVENWSFALDVVILWKTAGAVVRADGAY